MHRSTVYLDLHSRNEFQHEASLVAEDGHILANHQFDYYPDTLALFSETEHFDLSRESPENPIGFIEKFGQKLYQLVFSAKMHNVLQHRLHTAENAQLIIRCDATANKLNALAWETLHDNSTFLTLHNKMHIFRSFPSFKATQNSPIHDKKLRILCLLANPQRLDTQKRLAIEWEQEHLLQVLDPLLSAEQIEIDVEDEATLQHLESMVHEGDYHILHYIGHATLHQHKGASLLLSDDGGNVCHVSWNSLQPVLQKALTRGLRLVVFSGGQTAHANEDEGEAFTELARELLGLGVSAVITLSRGIADEARSVFTEAVYHAIADGSPLDQAVNSGRQRVLTHQHPLIQRNFTDPVLYSTDVDCLQKAAMPETRRFQLPAITLDPRYQLPLQQLGHKFVGRRRELRHIKYLFSEKGVHAVILHGMAKIGKTVTATQAAQRLSHLFAGVYAFDCSTAHFSPDQILLEIQNFLHTNALGNVQPLVERTLSPKQKASSLSQVLCQTPLFIIFDGLESLLDQETRRTFVDPEIATFLETLINSTTSGTKFLLTSRYTFHFRKNADNAQHDHFLNLQDFTRPEAIQFMQTFSSLTATSFRLKQKIYNTLGGHPYLLKVFAHYCQTTSPDKALQSTEKVFKEMIHLATLDLIWPKLTKRTGTLLQRISVFHKPIAPKAIEWVMGKPPGMLSSEIEELSHWGMIVQSPEGPQPTYTVHSIVRYFCWKQMNATYRHRALLYAAAYYQDLAQTFAQDSPIRVFTKLDARELFFKAETFEKAYQMVKDVYERLTRWGFISLSERLLQESVTTLEGSDKTEALCTLASFYQIQGECEKAIRQYRQACQLAKTLHNQSSMAAIHQYIGKIYEQQREYGNAMEEYLLSLQINETINDLAEMAEIHHQLGTLYQSQKEKDIALEHYMESLQLKERIGDQIGIVRTHHRLGNMYYLSGEYERALEEYRAGLTIAETLGDQARIARARHQIGNICYLRGDYEAALKEYTTSLQLSETLHDQTGIARAWHQIGIIHQVQGKNEAALEAYKASLQIAQRLGDQAEIARARHQIGAIYHRQGKYDAALKEYTASLRLKEMLGAQADIARTKGQIARIHEQRQEYQKAFEGYQQAYTILTRLHAPDARTALQHLRRLRQVWGSAAFDAAWQNVSHTPIPSAPECSSSSIKALPCQKSDSSG